MRRAFRSRVWAWSVLGGLAVGTAVLVAMITQPSTSAYHDLGDKNRETLARIVCRGTAEESGVADVGTHQRTCDISAVENDPAFEGSDYVLDTVSRYFIYNKGHLRGCWLNKSDVAYLRRFRVPRSVVFETGEQWMVYSEPAEFDGRTVEIMVTAFESAPWTLGQTASGPDMDLQLRKEAERISQQLTHTRISSRADGWQIVDEKTESVFAWSGDVPAFYPRDAREDPRTVHFEAGQVWLARVDTKDHLMAVSIQTLGSPYAFGLLFLCTFSLGALATYPVAKRVARIGIDRPISLDDALVVSENEQVEFKQELKDRKSFLKDVTAFANTKGGTVFIGVVDGTLEIVGIDAVTADRRDLFERGLRDSIRNSIQPSPAVDIDYPTRNDRIVARVFIPGSREQHSFEGRYYVREGSQSRYVSNGEIAHL